MPDEPEVAVTLVAVDDTVLDELVRVATSDAAADEVTPRVGDGTGWTAARVAWLRRFHRERRDGLDGPAGEATRAVVVDGQVVGAVRLQRTDVAGVLTTGAWLARAVRGRGVGRATLAAVLDEAARAGGTTVRADTTTGNGAALALVRGAGFRLRPGAGERDVQAELLLAARPGARGQ